jgi:hypothetical protein
MMLSFGPDQFDLLAQPRQSSSTRWWRVVLRKCLVPAYRRWPIGIPKPRAFCRIAPAVRFITLEIFSTGVLLLECVLRSRTCSLLQATRFVRVLAFFDLVAISLLPVEHGINSTKGLDDKQATAASSWEVDKPSKQAAREHSTQQS